jgi:membrane-associated phospholipid phosphatase
MIKLILLSLLLLFFCSLPLPANAADTLSYTPSLGQIIGNDIAIFGEDMAAYFTSPLHFSAYDWALTGAVIGGTVVIMSADNWANERAHAASHSSIFHNFMIGSKAYGEMGIAGGLIAATYGSGLIFDDPWLRITGRELAEALAFAGLTTRAIKFIAGRARPYKNMGNTSFIPFTTLGSNESLPSGHTTIAFTLSTILSERIHNIWASVFLYGAAACTGFSRMYDNQHWVSDILLAAAIGTTSGLFVAHRDEKRQGGVQASSSELNIYPYFGGIQASYRF